MWALTKTSNKNVLPAFSRNDDGLNPYPIHNNCHTKRPELFPAFSFSTGEEITSLPHHAILDNFF
jgi:hypothetical protein